MKRRKLVVAPSALLDLQDIYRLVRMNASLVTAKRYVGRIRRFLRGLSTASERGSLHSDLRPGLRSVGFEGRVQVAFEVTDTEVIVVRVFFAGQDWLNRLRSSGADRD